MSSGPPNAEDTTTTAPWADLLPELCDLILDRTDALGVIRFPAVCAAWAAAAADDSKNTPHRRPRRLPSGAPTLLTSGLDPEGYDVEYDVEPGAFGIHDVATGKSYYGAAEGLKKRTWIGGKDDWLVTTDLACSVELLNPVTGVRVPLPSFATIPGVSVAEVSQRGPGVSFGGSRHDFIRIRKVTLCRTPTTQHPGGGGGYLAVALFSPGDRGSLVAFTAAGDKRWMPLKNPESSHYRLGKYVDVTVHNGKVLVVDRFGCIYSWDMDGGGTSMEPTVLPPPDMDDYNYNFKRRVFYLATSSGGDLQLACMLGDDSDDTKDERWWRIVFDFQWSFWPRRVLLHELDAVTGAWRRVEGLGGGRALFVGANYPFYVDVPRDGSGDLLIKADCVYVADLISCHAGIFDLKQGDGFELNSSDYLYYPALQDPLQMPMWFRPTAALPECTSARSRSIEER